MIRVYIMLLGTMEFYITLSNKNWRKGGNKERICVIVICNTYKYVKKEIRYLTRFKLFDEKNQCCTIARFLQI